MAFFSKLIAVSGHQPNEIAYVADRLDNDLGPAAEAGLHTVLISADFRVQHDQAVVSRLV